MFEEACATSFFHFDRLYPTTDVSPGDGSGVIFFSVNSSFIWCEQFFPGRTFYSDEFYFVGKPQAKIQKPLPEATSILPISVSTISKCVLYRGRYQHTKFHTCVKTAKFCHLPLYCLKKNMSSKYTQCYFLLSFGEFAAILGQSLTKSSCVVWHASLSTNG